MKKYKVIENTYTPSLLGPALEIILNDGWILERLEIIPIPGDKKTLGNTFEQQQHNPYIIAIFYKEEN